MVDQDPDVRDKGGENRPETVLVGTEDAARVLKIASRTVRKRITDGELTATKLNGAWFVEMPADEVKAAGIPIPDINEEPPEHDKRPIVGASRAARAGSGMPIVPDLEPMVELIANLTRKSIEAAAAAAMWQERAHQLEERSNHATLALESGQQETDRKLEELQATIDKARQEAAEEARNTVNAEWKSKSWWKRLKGE